MEIFFNLIIKEKTEKDMGVKLFFNELPPPHVCDGISATANSSGFTLLTAAGSFYGWSPKIINESVQFCNNKKEILTVSQFNPILLLVHQTKGEIDGSKLISELIKIATNLNIVKLRFSHYSLILETLPKNEIIIIFEYLYKVQQNYSLTIICDIDSEFESELNSLYKSIFKTDITLLN